MLIQIDPPRPLPPAPGLPANRPGRVGTSSIRRGPLWLMRSVDHWVGLPLCFTLGAMVSLRHRFWARPERPIRDRGTIVVIKFFGLGSILEATPLLAGLRRRYPNARLAFLTFPANEALLRRLNLCSDVRVIRTRSPLQFVLDTLGTIVWMQRQDVDAVVDLEFFSKFSTLMAVLGGARRRIGYHLNAFWRRSLLTAPVYFNYYHHITDVFAQAGSYLDVMIEDSKLTPVPVTEDARQSVDQWLRDQGIPTTDRLIGINVNAGDMSLERRWPIEGFVDLIGALLERHPDLRVLLTGAPGEAEYVRTVHERVSETVRPRVLMTAGPWSLDQFIASFDRMAVFVTNDSGPMHLAAAQGAPLVSLWGPGRPDFYAPRATRHEVIYEAFPCSPCLYMFTTFEGMWCRHEGWCMQAITSAKVLAAVERLLAGGRDLESHALSGTATAERP
ncbi:MAG TPA: glycosyltransferase family 9 protein [Candidatus Limnocylindria bacterium]|nr:glycosyltransferase family 9 protein [Candidatus Limnocylindria bacterium]